MTTGTAIAFAFALALAPAMATAADSAAAPATMAPLAPLAAVVDELRQGGFVIYFRHAATEVGEAGGASEDVVDCATQRNLSAAGRAQARDIGLAVKALGIPIGTVTASPYCRTWDTARLAFGRVAADDDLRFALATDAGETRRLAAALRRMLATPAAVGRNDVIVAHTANLFEAAGIFPQPEGVAYVFRPLADGRFLPVARVLPGEWLAVARLRPQARGARR